MMPFQAMRLRNSGGSASGFWSAISAINPQLWLRMNDASGAVAANSGSGAAGNYYGTVDYLQGSLCSAQAGANSIGLDASGDYADGPSGAGSLSLIAMCYAGTAAGNTTTRILWRGAFVNTGSSYLRADMTNLIVQPSNSVGALTTTVPSSTIKDGNPHLIMLTRASDDTTNLRLWIDNTNVWTHAIGAGTFDAGGPIVIGRNGNTAQYCYGRYGDVVGRWGSCTSAQIAAIAAAYAP